MAKYTKLTDADIAAITKIYGLKITRFEPIDGGDANSSFLLNSLKSDYVLTVYEKKTLAKVDRMALMLKHLAKSDYYTNQVISTPDGSCVVEYHTKPVILKNWIPGDTLRDTDQKDYRSIGEAIASLHQIPAPHLIPTDHPYGLVHMPKALGHGFDLEYETWLADKIDYLQDRFPRGLPRHSSMEICLMTTSYIIMGSSKPSLISEMPVITIKYMIWAACCSEPVWRMGN